MAVDFDYKCPRCRSDDINIWSDGEYSWCNDFSGTHIETWMCDHCRHQFNVESFIVVRNRTIEY